MARSDVPDPDLRGRQRELQPPRQPRELRLAVADQRHLGLARRHELPAPMIGATMSRPARAKSARAPQSAGGGRQPPFGTAAIRQAPAGRLTSAVTGSWPRIAGSPKKGRLVADPSVAPGIATSSPRRGSPSPLAR